MSLAGIGVLAVLGFPALVFVSATLNGWALSILWGWFVAPVFGLPPLGIATAVGLALVVGFLTHQHIRTESKSDDLLPAAVFSVIKPAMTLLIGWIVTLFM